MLTQYGSCSKSLRLLLMKAGKQFPSLITISLVKVLLIYALFVVDEEGKNF